MITFTSVHCSTLTCIRVLVHVVFVLLLQDLQRRYWFWSRLLQPQFYIKLTWSGARANQTSDWSKQTNSQSADGSSSAWTQTHSLCLKRCFHVFIVQQQISPQTDLSIETHKTCLRACRWTTSRVNERVLMTAALIVCLQGLFINKLQQKWKKNTKEITFSSSAAAHTKDTTQRAQVCVCVCVCVCVYTNTVKQKEDGEQMKLIKAATGNFELNPAVSMLLFLFSYQSYVCDCIDDWLVVGSWTTLGQTHTPDRHYCCVYGHETQNQMCLTSSALVEII